ncbi:MAG: PQQ-binding-like beta-propeller repeat protein, partial [Trebonia sp.]|uniref:outer membrane protein assembly factor BamB family protein n=1 Tax=Trebonia sp. TaxID=2767075 RepID=UPI003BAE1BA1
APAPATSASGAAGPAPDWPMYHGDPAHDGVSQAMPDVSGALKVIKTVKLDGAVYASPIAVDGVMVVATENDSVYGFDARGNQLWHVSVSTPSPAYERPCGNIDPLGITGTPVYSAQTGEVYLAAEHGRTVGHDLIALDLHTGKVRWRKDIDLPGPTPAAMQQRGALAISGGRVWVSFGAEFGDCSNYKGRVVGVRLDGTGDPVMFDPSTRRQGGIWNPAGPTVDAAGHLYVVSANGSSFPGAAYDHTNSVLELSSSGKLLDSFAPTDWAQNNEGDVGLGSQGVALVGTKWALLGGKSGPVYVLRQGHLGGIGGQVSATDVCLPYGGAAVDGSVVYLPCTDGLRAVRVDSAGHLHVLWHASGQIAGSPVVGGGRVWALDQSGGVLHALDPATGQTLQQVSVGETSRFATPAIYGSLVLVPTLTGMAYVRTS